AQLRRAIGGRTQFHGGTNSGRGLDVAEPQHLLLRIGPARNSRSRDTRGIWIGIDVGGVRWNAQLFLGVSGWAASEREQQSEQENISHGHNQLVLLTGSFKSRACWRSFASRSKIFPTVTTTSEPLATAV